MRATEKETLHNETPRTQGEVTQAFGNLLQVRFQGNVSQGEVAYVDVGGEQLKAEVIEVIGSEVKLQVFEDTRGVRVGNKVTFSDGLLEAELGPGLLGSILDGLQNPLEAVADSTGLFLPRGVYLHPVDRSRSWDYEPQVKIGQQVTRGTTLGIVMEGRFHHRVMVPFSLYDRYTIKWVAPAGSYAPDAVVAKAVDSSGNELSWTMIQRWPVKAALIEGERISPSEMMETGNRIIDTQFPVMRGGTFCTPGPFGAGKTVLQHHLAKYSSVDIVVIIACGERAGEVVEVLKEFPHLVDPYTGNALMERTVIICNTSSMPVAARESSIYMGITIGEYYRQMGLNVLVLADSTSRWAQALREMSGRLEEIPGEEAFPAYLASRIAAFYERAGVIELKDGSSGSITLGGAVSPAGGNFEEPVTQATLAVVGAFWGLSRKRSDSRRYPAIDPLDSWSKYIAGVGKQLNRQLEGWAEKVVRSARLLAQGDEIAKRMEVVGEEGTAISDLITYLKAELYDFCFLQQNAFDSEDAYCPLKRQLHLFALLNKLFDAPLDFPTHDAARHFFVKLQNIAKNMNFVPFDSDRYRESYDTVLRMIAEQSQERELHHEAALRTN